MKHPLCITPEYNIKNRKNSTDPSLNKSYEYWLKVVIFARDFLNADKVELYVFPL